MGHRRQFPQIFRLGKDPVVNFAADELSRYLSAMTGRQIMPCAVKSFSRETKALYVGLVDDLSAFNVTMPCESSRNDTIILVTVSYTHLTLPTKA